MAWPAGIPEQTLELFEKKASGLELSGKSLEDIARAVIKTTAGFQYEWGRTRAFANCILFPWPHEVEQLGEVFCGTTALYRFLFAKFLKEKLQLDFDAVFLLTEMHGSVGLFDKKKKYVLESDLTEPSQHSSPAELDLEEAITLVEHIRAQNPLDILKKDQIIARSSREKVSDLTVQYDGKSLILNIAHFNKPGSTIGLWLKVTSGDGGVEVKRFYYVCPGSYDRQVNFDAEKCISHDVEGQRILVPKEDALKCIALDVIYSRALELRQKKKPDAKILGPEKAVKEIQKKEQEKAASKENRGWYNKRESIIDRWGTSYNGSFISYGCEDSREETGDENRFIINSKYNRRNTPPNSYNLGRILVNYSSPHSNEINRGYFEDRNSFAEPFSSYIQSYEKTLEEIDRSFFAEKFGKLPVAKLVQIAARMTGTATQEEFIVNYFRNFQQRIMPLGADSSLRGCVQRLTLEYLKRHGDAGLAPKTADSVLEYMFLNKWPKSMQSEQVLPSQPLAIAV